MACAMSRASGGALFAGKSSWRVAVWIMVRASSASQRSASAEDRSISGSVLSGLLLRSWIMSVIWCEFCCGKIMSDTRWCDEGTCVRGGSGMV